MSDPCKFLEWDTNFFGLRIGKVLGSDITRQSLMDINAWSASNKIRCLYFLASSNSPETTSLAEEEGFHLVDTRVTLDRTLQGSSAELPEDLRLARDSDLPLLEEWARKGFTDSRFFFDHHFPRERAAALYATWIRRDYQSPSSNVLVFAQKEDRPLGYISVMKDQIEKVGQIGLVGVDSEARGKGVGQTLVDGAIALSAGNGMKQIMVVTQGRNIAAQRLYQRCGFLVRSTQLWYHKWYPVNDRG